LPWILDHVSAVEIHKRPFLFLERILYIRWIEAVCSRRVSGGLRFGLASRKELQICDG